MEDKELNTLMEKVDYRTPLRHDSDNQLSDKKKEAKKESTDSKEKRVLLKEPSLSRLSNLDPVFGEATYEAYEAALNDSSSDEEYKVKTGTSNHDKKKYRLFLVKDASLVCGRVLTQGVTFCSNLKCDINHRTEGMMDLKSGQLYVQKSNEKGRSTTFTSPMMPTENIESNVVGQWLKTSQTLHAWSRIFRVGNDSLSESEQVTKEKIMEGKHELKSSMSYKTPKKEKYDDKFNNTTPSKYVEFQYKDDDDKSNRETNFSSHVNASFKVLFDEIDRLHRNQKILQDFVIKGSQSLDLRFAELCDDMGTKPSHLDERYDAPNLWGTIGEMVETLATFGQAIPAKLVSEEDVAKAVNEMKVEIDLNINSTVKPIDEKYGALRKFVISSAKSLKTQADENAKMIQDVSDKANSYDSDAWNRNGLSEDDEDRFKNIEDALEKLSLRQGERIRFHGLGFHGKPEADAWLELNSPSGRFGLIVDFSTIMEHIHHAITGMDALKQLQTVYKLKLSTISEALSVTSFEIAMPRFLSNTGAHVVIDNESSYFSHIPSFAKWNDPNSGFKLRLKKELERFRRSHLSTIREKLSVRDPLYGIATSSLTESISWTTGLINYIDNTFEEYSAGKFGAKKSWHVTTKLATALIMEVVKPREGALNSFQAGDAIAMSKVIFYANLQSLDAMGKIAADDYRDSPVVSSELVKFLSLNTNVEAVDKIEAQSAELNGVVKQLNKDVTSTTKSMASIGNKADELKKVVEGLRRRIEKLEK